MKPRTLILLMVAVGCGLVAAFLTSQLAGQKADMDEIPVAKMDLPQGTFIKPTDLELMFEKKRFEKTSILPGTIRNVQELQGKALQRTVGAGRPVSTQDLGLSEGLTKSLQPGYRAMTIRVAVDTAVAGFILPGAKVDLITQVVNPKDPRQTMSKIFMQNMLVLAVNTEDVRPENAKAIQPALITFAVKPEEAEKMARVISGGTPYMILRKPGDDAKVITPGAVTPFGQLNTDETSSETKEVPVARANILRGTKIDKDTWQSLFEMKPQLLSNIPEGARTEVDFQKLTSPIELTRDLAAGNILTPFFLAKDEPKKKDDGPEVVVVPTAPKFHILRIYQGSQPVQRHEFKDGIAESAPMPVPTPPAKDGSEGK
ncbi:MAG: Flp pilus assembly protein CpaB [Gemmataceae bacterium]|nr:Flp pilus assembly protein CpaB [Gemmataceae bacterium]